MRSVVVALIGSVVGWFRVLGDFLFRLKVVRSLLFRWSDLGRVGRIVVTWRSLSLVAALHRHSVHLPIVVLFVASLVLC